jgi:cyanophycinase-like exopeptidase
MGSGEITPNMVKVHRKIISDLEESFQAHERINAVSFATPYAFQENVLELSEKIATYFKISLNIDVRPVDILGDFLNGDYLNENQDELIRQAGKANFLFAGPGSPSFAVSRWKNGQFPNVLKDKLLNGGAIVFSSAAALTLGHFTVPVYEIYKVGAKPSWLKGLNVLEAIGIKAAVIPHFNNAEGGSHDTRYCYLGQKRLNYLKSQMDQDTLILGIDEHTAVIFDIDNETFEVYGLGNFTVETLNDRRVFNSGYKGELELLRSFNINGRSPLGSLSENAQNLKENLKTKHDVVDSNLKTRFKLLNSEFSELLVNNEFSKAGQLAASMLDEINSQDDINSDEPELNLSTLKSILLDIFEDFEKLDRQSTYQINSLIESLSEIRNRARQNSDFELADLIRSELQTLNIQLNDSASGTTWTILK